MASGVSQTPSFYSSAALHAANSYAPSLESEKQEGMQSEELQTIQPEAPPQKSGPKLNSYSPALPSSPVTLTPPAPDDPHFLTPELTGEWETVGVKSFYADAEKALLVDVYYPAVQNGPPSYRILPPSPPKHPMNTDEIQDAGLKANLANLWTRSQPSLEAAEGKFPVVIFSHGMAYNHFDYAGILEELASQGYYVFSISHPSSNGFSDLAKISYPEPPASLEQVSPAIYTQANEILFLTQKIKSSAFKETIGENIDIDRIGVMGHSLGGDSALQACKGHSDLIRTGIDLDSGCLKHIEQVEISQPFLSIGAKIGSYPEDPYEDAGEIWDGRTEWKRYKEKSVNAELEILDQATHNDFSVNPLFLERKTGELNPTYRGVHKEACQLITNWFNKHLSLRCVPTGVAKHHRS
ncbi:MAG: hypothetical protein JSR57_10320 [Verrucomicrobia bacterium]|nr:hypothetical protein [Verrucomicrobiota bacterium]